MKRICVGLTILIAIALLLSACAWGSGSEDEMLDGRTWGEALQSAEYQTQWTPDGVVRLEDGEYRARPARRPRSSSR
jgi:major membrane immunogen (membrane-anchored lipoprotein)